MMVLSSEWDEKEMMLQMYVDLYYKEENDLHKPGRKIPIAKLTRKLAVQTIAPPNTKGRSRRASIRDAPNIPE